MLNNLKQWLLNSSDTYRYFKDTIEDLKNQNIENQKTINVLSSKLDKTIKINNNQDKIIKKQNNEIRKLKKENVEFDKVLTSYNKQFNTLFLYSDIRIKGLLKYTQVLNQELLNFIVNVCKKHDLEYWMDFGLVLGAVRHKGFIPWDDDIDIGMMRADYDKLKEVIRQEIKDVELEDSLRIVINMNKYKPLPILQILHKELSQGVLLGGIDILPYDYVGDISNCDAETYRKIQRIVFKNNRKGVPIETALKDYFDEFDIHLDKHEYILPGIEGPRSRFTGYDFNLFKTSNIFPLKELEFENEMYYVPNNTDDYLTQTFGEYMNIPRIIHHHHKRFERLGKRDDAVEVFKQNIKLLKDANDTF